VTGEHLRMSDAEREQAAAELGEHYAQGRLTVEEHAERLDRIWSSRTRGELIPLFRDLPGTAYGPAYAGAPTARRPAASGGGPWSTGRVRPWRRLPTPFIVVLAVLLVLTVVTHLPLLLAGLLLWFFVVSRHRVHRRW
jgi:hypothetical protein